MSNREMQDFAVLSTRCIYQLSPATTTFPPHLIPTFILTTRIVREVLLPTSPRRIEATHGKHAFYSQRIQPSSRSQKSRLHNFNLPTLRSKQSHSAEAREKLRQVPSTCDAGYVMTYLLRYVRRGMMVKVRD